MCPCTRGFHMNFMNKVFLQLNVLKIQPHFWREINLWYTFAQGQAWPPVYTFLCFAINHFFVKHFIILPFTVHMIFSRHTISPFSPASLFFPCSVLLELLSLCCSRPKLETTHAPKFCPLWIILVATTKIENFS